MDLGTRSIIGPASTFGLLEALTSSYDVEREGAGSVMK